MSLAVLYGILVVGLYSHFRWALLNSHNHAGSPGAVATAIRAAIVAAVILTSAALAGGSEGIVGPVLWMFAIGFAFGPSLTPPRATDLGGPNTLGELLYERVVGEGLWALMKGGVVWLLAIPVGWIPVATVSERPEYWTMMWLAVVLGFMKWSFVMTVVHGSPEGRRGLGYAGDVRPEAIAGTAALGFAGLVIWTSVCNFFVADVPTVELSEVYGPLAMVAGLWLSGALEG